MNLATTPRSAEPRWSSTRSPFACALGLAASVAVGCSHAPPLTSRVVDGQPVHGRTVTTAGYASALRLALMTHGLVSGDRVETARLALLENPGDDEVLALAVELAGDDARVAAQAAARRGRSCPVDLALARRDPAPETTLLELVSRCPEAIAPALRACLDAGDDAAARGLARTASVSNDPDVESAVLVALVRVGDAETLGAFVALHRSEPRLVAEVVELASRAEPRLAAAMLTPLADDPAHRANAAFAWHAAGDDAQASALLRTDVDLPLDDTLRLAELALELGHAPRSLELAENACRRGASSRCDRIAADALDALARPVEASARRARLVP